MIKTDINLHKSSSIGKEFPENDKNSHNMKCINILFK